VKAQVRVTLLIIASVLIGIAVWASRLNCIERERRMSDAQKALSKAAEFLKTDTTSDLHFGRKVFATPTPSTPTPALP
jgi:hypothetical protein